MPVCDFNPRTTAPLSKRTTGFTLVELIMTLVIISIASVGIFSALSFALKHQSDGIWRSKSIALAESYTDQIMMRRFDEASPLGGVPACLPAQCSASAAFDDGESRAHFDDVDDYDGLDDMPPLDEGGVPLNGFAGYRVAVAVRYATATEVASFALNDPTDMKLITVSVTPPGKPAMDFRVVRANF